MIRVWFNHWFSTSYRLIELIKENREDIQVIGSNREENSVIQLVCDEWYTEPDGSGEEYIEFCLDFCVRNKINVFVPRREMITISEHKERFTAIGVQVMVDDYDIVKNLNNKATTYEMFKNTEGINVPDYYIVNCVEQFKEAYHLLKDKYGEVCMKFVNDEGGMSFRKITDKVEDLSGLRIYPGSRMTYDKLVDILGSADEFDDIMVMPYLPGEEISIDCLDTDSGLIAIPRIKGNARHEVISFQPELLEMAATVMAKTGLKYPCNIQFKCKDGIKYLLEINTRMSGGLQMACEAAEINIPQIALDKLSGMERGWNINRNEQIVSFIEMPRIIRKIMD